MCLWYKTIIFLEIKEEKRNVCWEDSMLFVDIYYRTGYLFIFFNLIFRSGFNKADEADENKLEKLEQVQRRGFR